MIPLIPVPGILSTTATANEGLKPKTNQKHFNGKEIHDI